MSFFKVSNWFVSKRECTSESSEDGIEMMNHIHIKLISLDQIESSQKLSILVKVSIRVTSNVETQTLSTKNVIVKQPSYIEFNEEFKFPVDPEIHEYGKNFDIVFDVINREQHVLATGMLEGITSLRLEEQILDIEMYNTNTGTERVTTLEIAIAGDGPAFK
jgi:hypothetical protein